MKIKLIEETCCEVCNEIIHVHIERCPNCNALNAPSDLHGPLRESWMSSEVPSFQCETCKAIFKATKSFKEIQRAEGIEDTEWSIE